MRLGQIKHILKTVSNDNSHLELKNEALANGAYYKVSNSESIKLAIEVLTDNKLVDSPDENTKKVFESMEPSGGIVLISAQDFNLIKNYLTSINAKLANIISVIDKLVQDQPEDIINIMLPNDVDSFKELDVVKKRIIAVLRAFRVTEEDIQIVGFDAGSKWYQIKIKNKKSIGTIIAATALAIQALDFFHSLQTDSDINVQVETMNVYIQERTNKAGSITQDAYVKSLVKKEISKLVKEYVEKISEEQLDGDTREAYAIMVENGVYKMFEERDKGLLFDPSLNPPEILNTNERFKYTINYEKLQELSAPQKEKQKELGTGEKPNE